MVFEVPGLPGDILLVAELAGEGVLGAEGPLAVGARRVPGDGATLPDLAYLCICQHCKIVRFVILVRIWTNLEGGSRPVTRGVKAPDNGIKSGRRTSRYPVFWRNLESRTCKPMHSKTVPRGKFVCQINMSTIRHYTTACPTTMPVIRRTDIQFKTMLNVIGITIIFSINSLYIVNTEQPFHSNR